MIPDSKVCTKCKEDKKLDLYAPQKDGKYGRKSICRSCDQARHIAFRHEKRRTDIRYFLARVYDNISKRCREQENYKGKLHMTRDQFYSWGNSTLPQFMQVNGLTEYTNQGITIDKIDDDIGYKIGNLQWLTHFNNSSKGAKGKGTKPVLQYHNGEIVAEYPSISDATVAMGKNPKTNHQITKHLLGQHKTAHGFVWKYKGTE